MQRILLAVGSAAALAGCATMFTEAAEKSCAGYGLEKGSPEYIDCVQTTVDRRVARFQQGLANASAISNSGMPQPAGDVPARYQPRKMGRFFKSSYISGTNRICIYDRMGSEEIETIPATRICPLN